MRDPQFSIHNDLDWIVMKCLEKHRARRYETATGLASDIQRHLDNEAVLARPQSAAYRFQKLVRRNKLAFAAVTGVVAALVLGIVASAWQAVRATRAEREQSRQREVAVKASASEALQRKEAEDQKNIAVEQRKLAEMQLALQAWDEGDLIRAKDLIAASRPAPGQTAGFEWRYLSNLCQDQSVETLGVPNHQYGSAQFFDRDLLMLNDEKTLTLHDISRQKDQLLLDDRDGIQNFALCPGNTNLLATVTDDGRIKVWDLAAKSVLVEFEKHPGSSIKTLAFSLDGRGLASASSDGSMKQWNVEGRDPKPVRVSARNSEQGAEVVFSPDRRHLISSGRELMIRTWDVATGAEAAAPLEAQNRSVYSVAISPDCLRLASGGGDSMVIIWDAISRKQQTQFLGHFASVMALAFSPDGQIIASGSRDHTIRLWDMKTGQQISVFRGHADTVDHLSFSPDGKRLVSQGAEGSVKLWQVTRGPDENPLVAGWEVALSRDGQRLAFKGGSKFGVYLWDLSTGRRTLLNGHSDFVVGLAFSTNGRLLATSSHDQTVRLWDVSDHKSVATLTNGFPAGSIAFLPDGRTLIVGGSKFPFMVGDRGGLQFWDVASRQATGSIPGDASDIVEIALSVDGSLLATAHKNGPVSLWDAQSRRLLHRFEGPSGSWVLSLAFSPTEPLLAAGDWGGNVELYNTATMEVARLPLKAHTARVMGLAFSPDGRTLASAGEGGGLKLWHVPTRQVALILKGRTGGIAFSKDGNFMATCTDGVIRRWPAPAVKDVAMRGEISR